MFARKTDAVFPSVDLNQIIEELVGMLEVTFPWTITFRVALDPDLPAIIADAALVHQSLLNLCVNARDAMPSGGVLSIGTLMVSAGMVKCTYSPSGDEEYVCVHVTDTGVGMDEETRARIFEPFFTTKEGKGTGLGLAVAHGVVKAHQGFIEVDSTENKGTEFRLFFPVTSPPESVAKESADDTLALKGGSETVLVVEDEPLLLDLLEAVLSLSGYRVVTAKTGREALEAFKCHADQIALVFSDLWLPELDGWTAFLRMREINPHLKAVFASGFLPEDQKTQMLQMEVHAVLQKPYVPNVILKTVRDAIDAKI